MNVLQEWVTELPLMQQSVLLTAIRGPDGIAKYNSVKMLIRWYRRCVLISAFDQVILNDPVDLRGGSFTGPSIKLNELRRTCDGHSLQHCDENCVPQWWIPMDKHVDNYLKEQDALPFHFQMHLMHAIEIIGYKHSDKWIRIWWNDVYNRLVNSMHLNQETKTELDNRLGDNKQGWLIRSDKATME
jgi:hypothetical protein